MSAVAELTPAAVGEQVTNTLLSAFEVDTKVLEANKEKYLGLELLELDDKKTYDEAIAGRRLARETRIAIQKKFKEFKAIAKDAVTKTEEKAETLIKLVSPVEDHCDDIVKRYEEEKERIRIDKLQQKAALVKSRVEKLTSLGAFFDGTSYNLGNLVVEHEQLVTYSDDEYSQCVDLATQMAEKIRLDKEAKEKADSEERQRLEAERKRIEEENAKLRAQQEEERKRMQAEMDALRKEREELEAEKKAVADAKAKELAEKRRAEKAEADRLAAEVKAKKDEEERIEREAREKKEAEAKKKADAARQKALAPDKKKLLKLADQIEAFDLPELAHVDAQGVTDYARMILDSLSKTIREKVEKYL
ncbi:hypothetical protein BWI93_02730 [Siphonobacter sp. BAB-5385]|uniref:hypothetical protein n=1 Tax=Siphonobacter sp. BAB-5385 TaxID=1864822 RepID=UPI000B9DF9C3|nr:hypothetical protein [Siphonobacter sp. BAB-5385]OZI09658.1 hypothetical protein BWI93_02730 [Siphonobacter sp. BAB-5385]